MSPVSDLQSCVCAGQRPKVLGGGQMVKNDSHPAEAASRSDQYPIFMMYFSRIILP